jgi:hypothetical protein
MLKGKIFVKIIMTSSPRAKPPSRQVIFFDQGFASLRLGAKIQKKLFIIT